MTKSSNISRRNVGSLAAGAGLVAVAASGQIVSAARRAKCTQDFRARPRRLARRLVLAPRGGPARENGSQGVHADPHRGR
jgi:hypothetical protein